MVSMLKPWSGQTKDYKIDIILLELNLFSPL